MVSESGGTGRLADGSFLDLTSRQRLAAVGHRAYVGGDDPETWYGIGRLQYQYLVASGLQPSHRFLDVACGALRLGQFLIPYLDAGQYHGLDAEEPLVRAGIAHELGFGLVALKRPRFAFNSVFDATFAEGFEQAMGQSLFTHLTEPDIALCFSRLAQAGAPGATFHFTYFEGSGTGNPAGPSDPHRVWRYPFERLAGIAADSGWSVTRIGDWGHPRGQSMAVARRSGG